VLFNFNCKVNGLCVAEGTGTATMVYEFQKAFLAFATSRSETLPDKAKGHFIKLDSLYNRKVGEYDSWIAESADNKEYYFVAERLG
jgi:hypothetical protein